MASFVKGPNYRTPFGRNVFLRSTQDIKTESYTLSAESVPTETIDGHADQKVIQPGTVLAKITSGAEIDKVGPFQGGDIPTNEEAEITVDATGGTFTVSFDGETTSALAFNVSTADFEAALEGLSNIGPGDVSVTGGPGDDGGTTPYTVEFTGNYAGQDVPDLTTDDTNLTGGATTAVVVVTDGGYQGAGASDGRGNPDNIVGLCNTFLPWQLMERDVEVAAVVECRAVQAWCFELDAAGARVSLSDATATEMVGKKNLSIMFA